MIHAIGSNYDWIDDTGVSSKVNSFKRIENRLNCRSSHLYDLKFLFQNTWFLGSSIIWCLFRFCFFFAVVFVCAWNAIEQVKKSDNNTEKKTNREKKKEQREKKIEKNQMNQTYQLATQHLRSFVRKFEWEINRLSEYYASARPCRDGEKQVFMLQAAEPVWYKGNCNMVRTQNTVVDGIVGWIQV